MMTQAILSTNGKITIPRAIRSAAGLQPGDSVSFFMLPDGAILVRTKKHKLSDLAGILFDPALPTISLEEMDAAIAGSALGREQK